MHTDSVRCHQTLTSTYAFSLFHTLLTGSFVYRRGVFITGRCVIIRTVYHKPIHSFLSYLIDGTILLSLSDDNFRVAVYVTRYVGVSGVPSKSVSFRALLHGAFFLLLLLKTYMEHYIDILLLAWLFISTVYVNSRLQADLIDKDLGCPSLRCLFFATFLIFCMGFMNYSLRERDIYLMFAFISPSSLFSSWGTTLWSIVLLDCSVKCIVLFIKSLLLVVPSTVISSYAMGTTLATIECISLLIRNSYACMPWILFFLQLERTEKAVYRNVLLLVLYIVLKLISFLHCVWTVKGLLLGLYADPPFKMQLETSTDHLCILCSKRISHAVLLCQVIFLFKPRPSISILPMFFIRSSFAVILFSASTYSQKRRTPCLSWCS
ncbi:unnamed protein product [Dicrocoelium dendriticum]|nr:unnamed protein product [Dicrocoelium dendriticum]